MSGGREVPCVIGPGRDEPERDRRCPALSLGSGAVPAASRSSNTGVPACDKAEQRRRHLCTRRRLAPPKGAGDPRHDGRVTETWFAVRCVFLLQGLGDLEAAGANLYEERITMWKAESSDDALAYAETEATQYAEVLPPNRYLGIAQLYEMVDTPKHGAEIFSLVRESDLPDDVYLDTFFDTGTERQRHSK